MSAVCKECHVSGDTLQLELEEMSLRKQKLEEALRAVDAASSHLIDAAARQEIEAYKRHHQSLRAIGESGVDRQIAAYVFVLKEDDYLILLKNIAQGSEGHTALLRSRAPTPSHNRAIICSEAAVKEFLGLAHQLCPETAVELSKQIQRQKTGSA